MCRLAVGGSIKQFSCKMDVPLHLWGVATSRVSGKSVEVHRVNFCVGN